MRFHLTISAVRERSGVSGCTKSDNLTPPCAREERGGCVHEEGITAHRHARAHGGEGSSAWGAPMACFASWLMLRMAERISGCCFAAVRRDRRPAENMTASLGLASALIFEKSLESQFLT